MNASVRPTDEQIETIVADYSDMLFRICFVMLCNEQDAEDAVQETFIKYFRHISKPAVFHDTEHEKAWLIKVAENICRNMIRFRLRHPTVDIDELYDYCAEPSEAGILEYIMNLPPQYKSVLHLYYAEQYKTKEIAEMVGISDATVRKRLQYGRELLKREYRDDNN